MSLRLRSAPENNLAKRTQSGKHRLLIISVAVLFVFAAMQVTQAQKKKETELRVDDGDVQSLNGKLQGFEGQLSQQEMGAMGLVLWRAATAPLDDPAGTNIVGSFFDLGAPKEAVRPVEKKKIGGAGPQPPAGGAVAQRDEPRPDPPPPPDPPQPPRLEVLGAALGVGDVSAGPKHDDPRPPPPDTIKALGTKLQGFGNQLSPKERGIMNWLLQRAGTSEARGAARNAGPLPGTPGGQPPSLGQALGFAAFGSRPGANIANGWVLRF